jgi:hypothetical protein
MILEKMFDVGIWIIEAIMNLMDVLPAFPESLVTALNSFFDLIFNNLTILGFFFPISFAKVIIPMMVVVINFEHIYTFIMWVLKKIPMINVK